MYAFLWGLVPGPLWVRILVVLAVFVALVFVLFEWVFPWVAPLLPFQQQTVTG